jgi:hypothetical protein
LSRTSAIFAGWKSPDYARRGHVKSTGETPSKSRNLYACAGFDLQVSWEAKMGFLIGIVGLIAGFAGFWFDFSADPFAAKPPQAYFDLGVGGVALAFLGFIVQMWPRRRVIPKGPQAV